MPIKILYIEHVSSILGGGQVSLYQLLSHLDRSRFEPVVIVSGPGPWADKLRNLNVKILYLDIASLKRWGAFKIPYYLWKIFQIVRSERIQLIHNSIPRIILLCGLISKLTQVPLIWHVRVVESDGWLDWLNYRLVDRLILISKAVAARFKDSKNKIRVIYNGVDVSKFNPIQSRDQFFDEHHLAPDRILIGNVSQLIPWKDHPTFLRAAKRVVENIPKAHMLIVGAEIVQ